MDGNVIVLVAVYGAFGLMGLGILSMVVSAIKSLMQGKQDFKRIAIMAVPFIVFGISYAVAEGDIAKAGVMTTMVMMIIMVVMIVLTGLRGTFKF